MIFEAPPAAEHFPYTGDTLIRPPPPTMREARRDDAPRCIRADRRVQLLPAFDLYVLPANPPRA
jgi:hypothetical protein